MIVSPESCWTLHVGRRFPNRTKETFIVASRVCAMTFLVVLVLAALAQAQTFNTLYDFTGGTDGGNPYAGLIQDPAGNLYSTTSEGGDLSCGSKNGCGVVFKMNTAGKETVLHSFTRSDGSGPVAPLTRDKAGNLYGTTFAGGSNGQGAVFKIDKAGSETVLYSFTGGSDGCNPYQGLVRDKAGNLYGTTESCGSSSFYGTIFKVVSAGKFTVLHVFNGGSSDGANPFYGHLTMDKTGNLYGVTGAGGASGKGLLYKLSKKGTFTVLHSFAGGTSDGCSPNGSVVQDKAGNLYGTTFGCGSNSRGTIWKVSKNGNETILHNFAGGTSDGCIPVAGVTRDSKGNLYGVATACGANTYGVLYELGVSGAITLLHSFDSSDGAWPYGEVWRAGNGALFGTTYIGGDLNCNHPNGCGTVWSYVP